MALINLPKSPVNIPTIITTNLVTNKDTGSIAENTSAPLKGNLLTNDFIPSAVLDYRVIGIRKIDGTTLSSPSSVLVGKYGSITVDSLGNYQYVLDNGLPEVDKLRKGQSLSEQFYYASQVIGQTAVTGNSTLTITITGTNDAPIATADVAEILEDAPVLTGSVATNDTDVDHTADELKYSLAEGQAAVAGFTFNPDGSYSFDPSDAAYQTLNTGETQVINIGYTVTDADGASSKSTLTITVIGVSEELIAIEDKVTVTEDETKLISFGELLANDTGPNPDELTIINVDGSSSKGSVTLLEGEIQYVAGSSFQSLKPGQSALDEFFYTVKDNTGVSKTARVVVTVTGINDAPTAVADSAFTSTNTPINIDVLANDTDPESDSILISGVSKPTNGTAIITADGKITYSPNTDFAGTDSFTYTVRDEFGAESTGTVSLVVGLSDHDAIGGDVFLQGNFMEIGVSSAGSLGTRTSAPSNYHPADPTGQNRISFVVDQDGWEAGAPPASGDFTLPGAPVDTIVLGIGGTSYVQDERSSRKDIATTTIDRSVGDNLAAQTSGTIAGAKFTQLIELSAGATFYKTTITVENVTSGTLNDVRFMRSFDPDQDVFAFGNFNTFNDVLSNPSAGNDIATSRATGTQSGVSVNLVSFDSDARASNFGFANYDVYNPAAFDAPVDRNGASEDRAITLAFKMGDIAVGKSITKTFFTSLNGNQNANDMTLGTTEDDTVDAGLGDDIIIGYSGNDTLIGNSGNDKFIFSAGSGQDAINDFTAGKATDDVIELRGFGLDSFEEVRSVSAQEGLDVLIALGSDSVRLVGVNLASLDQDDFIFA